jgi:hypothetical protein
MDKKGLVIDKKIFYLEVITNKHERFNILMKKNVSIGDNISFREKDILSTKKMLLYFSSVLVPIIVLILIINIFSSDENNMNVSVNKYENVDFTTNIPTDNVSPNLNSEESTGIDTLTPTSSEKSTKESTDSKENEITDSNNENDNKEDSNTKESENTENEEENEESESKTITKTYCVFEGYSSGNSYNYENYFWRHSNSVLKLVKNVSSNEDSHFIVTSGLYDTSGSYVSFKSVNYSGYYISYNESEEIVLDKNDGTTNFKMNATFKEVNGLANSNGVSYQTYKYSNKYIRHKNFILKINKLNVIDYEDATFYRNQID